MCGFVELHTNLFMDFIYLGGFLCIYVYKLYRKAGKNSTSNLSRIFFCYFFRVFNLRLTEYKCLIEATATARSTLFSPTSPFIHPQPSSPFPSNQFRLGRWTNSSSMGMMLLFFAWRCGVTVMWHRVVRAGQSSFTRPAPTR